MENYNVLYGFSAINLEKKNRVTMSPFWFRKMYERVNCYTYVVTYDAADDGNRLGFPRRLL